MKSLLLFPKKYSLAYTFFNMLSKEGEAIFVHHNQIISKTVRKFNAQVFRLPDKFRQRWETYYFGKINDYYRSIIVENSPNLIFVYNSAMLLPDTVKWIKAQGIKLLFYLGDAPFYTPTNRYNLTILDYADSIFVPDSFWKYQLEKSGLKNVHWLMPPLPVSEYYPIEEPLDFKHDILYVGMCYKNAWGYKKAKFLNEFTDFSLQIYGNDAWEKWMPFFPKLRESVDTKKGFIPTPELNEMYNRTKIIPIDGNPAIQHGMHVRVGEALAAGTMPLCEHTPDAEHIFQGINYLPLVKSIQEIKPIATYYLERDDERLATTQAMRACYEKTFSYVTVKELIMKNI